MGLSPDSDGAHKPFQNIGLQTGGSVLVGSWVDVIAMGGLACIVWLAIQVLPPDLAPIFFGENSNNSLLWCLLLAFWAPHMVCSWWPLYQSRERILTFPMTALLLPAAILLGAFVAVGQPSTLLVYWCKFAVLWAGYHYSTQTLGLSIMYARRAKHDLRGPVRFLLGLFVFISFLYSYVKSENADQWGISWLSPQRLPPLALPDWLHGLALIGMALSCLGGIAFVQLYRKHNAAWPPLLVCLPPIAQFLWLVPGNSPFGDKIVWFAGFHGLQYILMSVFIHLRSKMENADDPPMPHYLKRELFRYLFLITLLGVVFTMVVPYIIELTGTPEGAAVRAIVAALFIHHTIVDGALWKARCKEDVQRLNGAPALL